VLFLLTWGSLPIFLEGYSWVVAGAALVIALFLGLPVLIYVSLPLWKIHAFLKQAKEKALEDLWPTMTPTEPATLFAVKRQEMKFVHDMSTWPLGSITPIVILCSQAAAALLKLLAPAKS
jgi:hypothetical protein